MDQNQALAERFEEDRQSLVALCQRILGSRDEAEDAVQEAWLRLENTDITAVRNLSAWLRTVTSHVCLDMLRSRHVEREAIWNEDLPPVGGALGDGNPESEVLWDETVGDALLVVLNTLSPAEQVAFILHDSFGVPFGEIGRILGRSQVTAKKASQPCPAQTACAMAREFSADSTAA